MCTPWYIVNNWFIQSYEAPFIGGILYPNLDYKLKVSTWEHDIKVQYLYNIFIVISVWNTEETGDIYIKFTGSVTVRVTINYDQKPQR